MKNLILLFCAVLVVFPLSAQWVEKSDNISPGADIRFLAIHENLVVAGTSSGVYFSQNNGEDWTLESEIGTSDFRAIASSPNFIYAANTSRVVRKNLTTSVWDTLVQ